MIKLPQRMLLHFADLQKKHPSLHPEAVIPTLANDPTVTSDAIVRAIQSFPCGSAGGPDGLRPQHLKD